MKFEEVTPPTKGYVLIVYHTFFSFIVDKARD